MRNEIITLVTIYTKYSADGLDPDHMPQNVASDQVCSFFQQR